MTSGKQQSERGGASSLAAHSQGGASSAAHSQGDDFSLAAHSTCSRRSKRLIHPPMSYLGHFFQAIADQWCGHDPAAMQRYRQCGRGAPPGSPPPAARRPTDSNRPCLLLASPFPRRHPKSNPDGWIPLAVAENRVGGPAFLERLEAASIGAPPAVLNYAK